MDGGCEQEQPSGRNIGAAAAKCRGGCMPQEKNPPLATGPKFREDSHVKSIRECAVCCESHTQRNSASRIWCPGAHRTQFHFVKRNACANRSAARPRRAVRGSLAVCNAGRHGAGMAADKNGGGRDQHGDHNGKRQEFHCHELHCGRPLCAGKWIPGRCASFDILLRRKFENTLTPMWLPRG